MAYKDFAYSDVLHIFRLFCIKIEKWKKVMINIKNLKFVCRVVFSVFKMTHCIMQQNESVSNFCTNSRADWDLKAPATFHTKKSKRLLF
jgi:hypothetical protein